MGRNTINREDQRFLLIVLALSFILFNLVYIQNNQVPVTAPDESGVLFFAKNILENNQFLWKSELNEKYNSEFFRPRSVSEYKDNLFTPRTSIFYSLILAVSKLYRFEFMVVSLLGVLGVVYLFLIVKNLFDSYRTGIIGAILLSIYPPFLTYANSYFDIIPSLVFWLISLRYYQRFIDNGMVKYLIISIVMFGVSVAIRPPIAILLTFFIPITLFNYKKVLSKKNILFSLITIIFTILTFLGINKVLYGSFLSSGRSFIGSEVGGSGFGSKLTRIIIVTELSVYPIAFKNYLLPYSLLFVLGLTGLILVFRNNHKSKQFGIGFVTLALFLFLFFGGNPTQAGFYNAQIRGSLSRHFIPIGITLIIYASYFITKIEIYINKSHLAKITKTFMAFAIVTVLLITSLNGPASLDTVLHRTGYITHWVEFADLAPEKSVFVGKRQTTPIALKKPVLLIFDKDDLVENPNLNRFYPIIDLEKELLPLFDNLEQDGYTIYITAESERAKEILLKNGYAFRKHEGTPFLETKKWN
jgi:hypothetical protein